MKNGEKKCSVVRGKASCDYPPVCKEKGRKRRNTLLEMASLPVYSSPNHSSSHIDKHNQDSYSYGQSHSQKNGYSHQTVAEVPHAPSFHAETAGASSLADFLSPSPNPPPQYVGFGDTGSSATHFSHENDSHRITRTSPSLLNVSKLIPESDLLEGSLSQTSVNCHHHRRRLRRRRQRCTAFENARREMEMGMGESNYFSEDAEGEALDVNCSSSQFSYYKRIKDSEAHSLSERKRRKRINEKMRALQELIPNSNKTDKASMLDEAIEYLKMLQMQIQSMAIGNGLMMSLMTPYIQMPIFNPLMHIEYMALARPWVESSIGCSVFQGNVNWAPFGMSPMMSFLNPVHASPPSSTLPVPSSVPTNFTKNPLFRLPQG